MYPLSEHVRRTPGGEDRQQPDGGQDHRHQEHESHCICHATDYPTFAAHPTVAAMTTVDNILPFLPLAQPCDDELLPQRDRQCPVVTQVERPRRGRRRGPR
jgi:hypothetical protein